MKLHREMTMTVAGEDMRTLLTEAICEPTFSPFAGLRVWKIWQAEGDKFVVELEPIPKPQPKPAVVPPKIDGPQIARAAPPAKVAAK